MKDISITDYLGPGVYLLYNYPQESGALIAERVIKYAIARMWRI
jgi:hypothetical protein